MGVQGEIKERRFWSRFDGNLAVVILVLNLIGLINLYSATHGAMDASESRLFFQQVLWLMVGWGGFFALTVIDYSFFQRMAFVFYGLNLLALVAVSLFGKVSYGAQRWLDLGFFRYQPSETMKLALVILLAKVLARDTPPEGLGLRSLVLPLLITGVPFFLTVRQPDLGTALLFFAIAFSMFAFVGVKRSISIAALIFALIAIPLTWTFGLKTYQKNRIVTFLTPGHDPQGVGYNSIQSRIAVGSGKVFGKGFRKGTQSQLEFLPERHTDFIFSVLSEEHGFIGSISMVGCFVVLFLIGFRVATNARDKFGMLLTVGILSILFWHVFINVGMVIGLLPIVGVPLPLLSYGGSSLLTTMAGLGLVSGVAYRRYLF